MCSLEELGAHGLNDRDVMDFAYVNAYPNALGSLDKEKQIEVLSYSIKVEGDRIRETHITNESFDIRVRYNLDIATQEYIEPRYGFYPPNTNFHKYCGTISFVQATSLRSYTGTTTGYKNGKLLYTVEHVFNKDVRNIVFNGKFKQYYPDGDIEISGQFKNGVKVGYWSRKHPITRNRMLDYFYEDDRISSTNNVYYPSGTLHKVFEMDLGEQVDYFSVYYNEGDDNKHYKKVFESGKESYIVFFDDDDETTIANPIDIVYDFSIPTMLENYIPGIN
jgi:hypothetical protein